MHTILYVLIGIVTLAVGMGLLIGFFALCDAFPYAMMLIGALALFLPMFWLIGYAFTHHYNPPYDAGYLFIPMGIGVFMLMVAGESAEYE